MLPTTGAILNKHCHKQKGKRKKQEKEIVMDLEHGLKWQSRSDDIEIASRKGRTYNLYSRGNKY